MSPDSPRYPTRRYLSAEERKREILEVAAPLFFARGYEGAEMAEIACRAGVSRALLHRHFGGKQEILLEIVREVAAAEPGTTLRDRSIPLEDRIAANAEIWLDHFEATPNLSAVTQVPIGGNAAIGAAVEEVRERLISRILEDYFDGAEATELLRVMMRGYVAMILTLAHEWLWRDHATREQVRVVMVTVIETLMNETVPALQGTAEAQTVEV